MDKNNLQLQALAKIFNTDKIISQSDVEQVLKGVLQIMNSFKSSNEILNAETKKSVAEVLDKVEQEYEKIIKTIDVSKGTAEKEISSYATKQIDILKSLLNNLERTKKSVEYIIEAGIKNGEPGADADEEYIIQELAKLIPPPQKIELDDGEKIISKINEAKEGKIKASQISDLPKFTREVIREVGGHGGAYETPIKAGSNVTVRKDAQGAYVISSTGGGAGGGQVNSVVAGTGVTVDSTDPANPIVSAIGSGDMLKATYDPAAVNEQLVGRTATQTITNKTLSSPIINSGSLGASSVATTQNANDNSTKLATTAYVDNAVLSTNYKEAVKYGSVAALPAIVYANGSSGVGRTLTGVALAAISLDGASPGVGDRVLIKNQVAPEQNGIYVVTQTGSGIAVFILTGATDFDQAADIKTGDTVFVTAGNTLANTSWAYTGIDFPTMGTTALTFAQVSADLIVGQSVILSGTTTRVLYDNAGALGEYTVSGTGSVAMTTSPTLTTPIISGTPASSAATGYDTTQNALSVYSSLTSSVGLVPRVLNVSVNPSDTLTASVINTTETAFASTYTIPAGALILGKIYKVTMIFNVVTSGSPPTFLTRMRITNAAGTVIFSVNAVTPAINLPGRTSMLVLDILGAAAVGATANTYTTPSSGSLLGSINNQTTQPVALATNGAIVLVPTLQFSANTAGNSLTLVSMRIQELN